MANLTTVPFHGGTIEATQDERGVWISVRRVCESIDLSFSPQLSKLKNKPWAVMTMIVTTAADGKNYESACIHVDSLPMWLATIDAARVSEAARPMLTAYQTEAARVLRDHFIGAPPSAPPPAPQSEPLALA
ncbi:hypothetical protein H9X90_15750, partial [Faecalicatena contorta]|uniref:phage antirepressor N-terminal domain-containing protein n=1 Tax=Faecalicatena contorta TaxID=39482 RepID=UPI0019602118